VMAPLPGKTFYEILDVGFPASPYEIRRAYEEAHDLYSPECIGSYSFFTETERRTILSELEHAYLVLIDSPSRFDYDRGLIAQGRMDKSRQYRDKKKMPAPLYVFRRDPAVSPPAMGADPAADEDPLLWEMLRRETLSGADLKWIREKRGVSLDHVFFRCRVGMATLQALEEDHFDLLPPRVYVKGFLKSYARVLGIAPDRLALAYLNHMDRCKGTPYDR